MKSNRPNRISKLKTVLSSLLGKILPAGVEADTVVGLDIGQQDIKIAQYKRHLTDNVWIFDSSQIIKLSVGVDKKNKDRETVKGLKKFFAAKNLKKTKIACIINDVNGAEKLILTPLMTNVELKEAIHWKMKDFIHYSLDDAVIDFKIAGKVDIEGETKDEIFAVAFPESTIKRYLSLFRQAEVPPAAFISLATCIEHNLSDTSAEASADAETIAFVDLGATHTQLVIFRNKRFVFSRQLPVAGDAVSNALSTVLEGPFGRISLTFEEAEEIKKQCGIPASSNDSITNKNITANQILSLMRPEIEKLAGEIEHSFDYYCEEFQAAKVDCLVLIGGGADLKGINSFLCQQLGIPVYSGNPFANAEACPVVGVSSYACVGAAKAMLKQIKEGIKEINLLPREVKEKNKLFIKRLTFEVTATVIVLVMLLVWMGLKLTVAGIHKRLEVIETQFYSLGYKQREVSLKRIIGNIYAREPYWIDVFRELSNVIPENLYLESLVYSADELLLQGVIISKTDTTQSVLSNFMLSLENGIFKNVSLIESKSLKDGERLKRTEFQLKCQIE